MEGHIEDKLSGHISQHQFKIVRRGEKAVTFYKKWSTSPEWLPKCSDGAINESNELFLVHSLPSGIPDHIEPSTDKINVKKLKSDLENFNVKFDNHAIMWWETLEDLVSRRFTKRQWFLCNLTKLREVKNQPQQITEEDKKINAEIKKLMEKQTKDTEVL